MCLFTICLSFSCLLSHSLNLDCLHTDLFTVVSHTHMQLAMVMSLPPLYFPAVTYLLSPLSSVLYPTHCIPVLYIYSDTWGPLFCFVLTFHIQEKEKTLLGILCLSICVLQYPLLPSSFSANGRVLFFLLCEWHFFVYVYHTFFVHSYVDEHLSWCRNLV